MAGLLQLIAGGTRKGDGSVNAGGRAFLTEVAPSTTPVLGYTDRDKTASHTLSQGGILLDSNGGASIYVDSVCDVRLEDSAGAAIGTFTAEPVVSSAVVEILNSKFTGTNPSGVSGAGYRTFLSDVLTSLGLSAGGLDGKYKGTYGSTSRNIYSELDEFWFNAKRFGVIGDGNTDDTSNLQAAINACSGAGGGIVYVPAGTYLVSAALTVPTLVTLVGQGRGAAVLKNTNTATGILSLTGSYAKVKGFTLSHSSSSTGKAIQASGATDKFIDVREVVITGHRTGVYSVSDQFSMEEFDITTTAADAAARGVDLAGDQTTYLRVGLVSAGTGYGVQYIAPANVAGIENSLIMQGVRVNASARGLSVDGAVSNEMLVAAHGCSFKGSTVDVFIGSNIGVYGVVWLDPTTRLVGTGTITNNSIGNVVLGTPTSGGLNMRPLGADGYQEDIANTGTAVPKPQTAGHILYRATSAGGGTIAAPTAIGFRTGHRLVITFYNNSGGAFAWTLNAVYHVVAAPAPANGSKSTMEFVYDGALSTWNQVGAVATVVA